MRRRRNSARGSDTSSATSSDEDESDAGGHHRRMRMRMNGSEAETSPAPATAGAGSTSSSSDSRLAVPPTMSRSFARGGVVTNSGSGSGVAVARPTPIRTATTTTISSSSTASASAHSPFPTPSALSTLSALSASGSASPSASSGSARITSASASANTNNPAHNMLLDSPFPFTPNSHSHLANLSLRGRSKTAAPVSPITLASAAQKKHQNHVSRVATIMKRESRPFDDELAHESATMAFLNRINPSLEISIAARGSVSSSSPSSATRRNSMDTAFEATSFSHNHPHASNDINESPTNSSAVSPLPQHIHHHPLHATTTISPTDTNTLSLIDEALLETTVPLPRTIPIPNAHLKDPASYASHTSKLNPENSQIVYRQSYETASPILSPSANNAMMLSPVVRSSNKRKLSIGSEDRYEPYKRRAGSGIPHSPSANSIYMSPTAQPMSLPNSPSTHSWHHHHHLHSTHITVGGNGAGTSHYSSSNNGGVFAHPSQGASALAAAAAAAVASTSGGTQGSSSGTSTPMSGIQQPLLPGPVMGLMLSHHPYTILGGSPMMRRSTSASSVGSNGHSIFGGESSRTGGGGGGGGGGGAGGSGGTLQPPGSPRVGVVFGGGANVVVASPRAAAGAGGVPFGQLLNMGGAQDHLSKMSLS
ncbi:hypothetical protein BC830DRAFT_1172045 [Chytriomyces sp. MP71]|nr:hypothetical protein BC830DRAFT_1172045 [Chytriomyces sp. MP71]